MKAKTFIIIFIFFYTLLMGKIIFAYTLPLPENTTKQNEQKIIFNSVPHTTEMYQSQFSPQEIISFYKENLVKEGFLLAYEDKYNNLLLFYQPSTKENLRLAIALIGNGLTYFSIDSWKGELPIIEPKDIKKQADNRDASGRDVPGIPRYPGSIRISSLEQDGMKNAAYKVPCRAEDIISFYENKMPSYGWKRFSLESFVKNKAGQILGEEELFSSKAALLFEKGNNLCAILVVPVSGCRQGCSPGMGNIENSMLSIGIYKIGKNK